MGLSELVILKKHSNPWLTCAALELVAVRHSVFMKLVYELLKLAEAITVVGSLTTEEEFFFSAQAGLYLRTSLG